MKRLRTRPGSRLKKRPALRLKKKRSVSPVERVRFTTDKLYEDNTLDAPKQIVPVREALSGTTEITLPPCCFDIYVFTLNTKK